MNCQNQQRFVLHTDDHTPLRIIVQCSQPLDQKGNHDGTHCCRASGVWFEWDNKEAVS